VKLAVGHLLPFKPDFIVSGINRGPNLGFDTLYSGTVSAALEGALFGTPGIAVSSTGHDRNNMHYETAAKLAVKVFEEMADKLPKGSIYNLNVPSCALEDLKGLKATTLGRRIDDDNIIESLDPRSRPYYWLGGGFGPVEEVSGSDCVEIKNGFATISVLSPSLFNQKITSKVSQDVDQLSDKIFA
jgi:5'-nucleotidase